ncbi:MAG: hypothetical protein WA678_05195, partial [Rhabdochlamydiaceae bacterium]
VIYEGLILPPEFESKIGSKEPENRLKLNPQTVSEFTFLKKIIFAEKRGNRYTPVERNRSCGI